MTQREAGRLLEAHEGNHETHRLLHDEKHDRDRELVRLHEKTMDAAFEAHRQVHLREEEARSTAFTAVTHLADVHGRFHDKEHAAHEQRHEDARLAIGKGEDALDKRLAGLNGVYGQMREQSRNFASSEIVTTLQQQMDRRFDETRRERDLANETLRARIEVIEKSDVKSEGRGLGQSAVIAYIIAGVSFVGSLVVLLNVLTS